MYYIPNQVFFFKLNACEIVSPCIFVSESLKFDCSCSNLSKSYTLFLLAVFASTILSKQAWNCYHWLKYKTQQINQPEKKRKDSRNLLILCSPYLDFLWSIRLCIKWGSLVTYLPVLIVLKVSIFNLQYFHSIFLVDALI